MDECRRHNKSLLHTAARDDNFEGMSCLCQLPYIQEIIDDDSNKDGWTPLLAACSQSSKTDLRLIELLVANGADFLRSKSSDGMTALHMAATNNDIHLMQYLVSNTYSKQRSDFVNQPNEEGWTPAHFAAFFNNFDGLNFLIENGADLLKRSKSKMCSVDEVIRNDHADLLSCIFDEVRDSEKDRDL